MNSMCIYNLYDDEYSTNNDTVDSTSSSSSSAGPKPRYGQKWAQIKSPPPRHVPGPVSPSGSFNSTRRWVARDYETGPHTYRPSEFKGHTKSRPRPPTTPPRKPHKMLTLHSIKKYNTRQLKGKQRATSDRNRPVTPTPPPKHHAQTSQGDAPKRGECSSGKNQNTRLIGFITSTKRKHNDENIPPADTTPNTRDCAGPSTIDPQVESDQDVSPLLGLIPLREEPSTPKSSQCSLGGTADVSSDTPVFDHGGAQSGGRGRDPARRTRSRSPLSPIKVLNRVATTIRDASQRLAKGLHLVSPTKTPEKRSALGKGKRRQMDENEENEDSGNLKKKRK